MKLGAYLLQTCKLCKTTAIGRVRVEAEWWEHRILEGIEALKNVNRTFDRESNKTLTKENQKEAP